jgi:hypothetical protein
VFPRPGLDKRNYNADGMSEFWVGLLLGFLLGFIGNILANHYWELRTRFRTHVTAKKLVGTWTAYNMQGRVVDSTPMQGSGPTVISATPHWWSANSGVLQVSSRDTSDGRHHGGPLVIDPICPRLATRILIYDAPTDEVVEQRIIISHDFKTLYVFYVLATFGLSAYRGPAHVLCKDEGADTEHRSPKAGQPA